MHVGKERGARRRPKGLRSSRGVFVARRRDGDAGTARSGAQRFKMAPSAPSRPDAQSRSSGAGLRFKLNASKTRSIRHQAPTPTKRPLRQKKQVATVRTQQDTPCRKGCQRCPFNQQKTWNRAFYSSSCLEITLHCQCKEVKMVFNI